MAKIVLVDGDPVVYRVGFAGEQRVIHAIVEGPEGAPFKIRFENKTDRNNWLAENAGHELVDEEEEVIAEPLPFVLQTCKQIMGVLETLGSPKVYLTASGPEARNFRNKLATVVGYKANRKGAPRPVHYAALREYLQERWSAQVINGREADDELSIQAARLRKAGKKYVVASIDKDLDQIPGEHYDYAQHVTYHVTQEQADKFFWRQVLSGDRVDNIPGCYRIGPTKAEKLVDGWYLERLSWENIWYAVCYEYHLSRQKNGCPYADKDPHDIALETARLVYMQKEAGELWNPPGIPFGRVEELDAND